MLTKFFRISRQIKFLKKYSSPIIQSQKIIQIDYQRLNNKPIYHFQNDDQKEVLQQIRRIYELKSIGTYADDLLGRLQNYMEIAGEIENILQIKNDKFWIMNYSYELCRINLYQTLYYTFEYGDFKINTKRTQIFINCDIIQLLEQNKQDKQDEQNYDLEERQCIKLRIIRLKSASIITKIMISGVEINLEQLHQWMNDYLDQIDLEYEYIKKEFLFDSNDISYLYELRIPIFYFLVARIFKQRNLDEEFERFINLGLDELNLFLENSKESHLIDEYKIIIIFLSRLAVQLEFNGDVDKKLLLNIYIYLFKLLQKEWDITSSKQYLLIKVMVAQYLQSQDHFDKTYELLFQAYQNKELIDTDDQQFFLYSNIYYCQQKGYFQDLDTDSVIKLADQPQNVNRNLFLIQLLEFNMCVFDDELEKKNFDSLQVRFFKILDLIRYQFLLIDQTKIKANLPVFNWIDLIMQNKIVKNNNWIIQAIYDSLKQFVSIQLFSETQEFNKNFYLAILPYKIQEQQPNYQKNRLKNLENFILKYLQNQNMQNIVVNKLILFNFSMIEDQQYDECLKVIECLSTIVLKQKKEKELSQFTKQLQNQKNQISKLKNKKQ
ncbi:unnamed protein product [Paramecium sonneborni]|uniref:Uncharacterized protein n=1 Tax=Paramecium sonneborni TaxID=65129 RepID=A0A8S1PBP2_9CILI|nr:unnamed protein product [Paramecium sonneborni]